MSSFSSITLLLLFWLIYCISLNFFCFIKSPLDSESLTSLMLPGSSRCRYPICFLKMSLTYFWYISRYFLLVNRTPRANFLVSPSIPWVTAWLDFSLRAATISHLVNDERSSFLKPRSISFCWMSVLLSFLKSASVPVTAFGFWIAGFRYMRLIFALFRES